MLLIARLITYHPCNNSVKYDLQQILWKVPRKKIVPIWFIFRRYISLRYILINITFEIFSCWKLHFTAHQLFVKTHPGIFSSPAFGDGRHSQWQWWWRGCYIQWQQLASPRYMLLIVRLIIHVTTEDTDEEDVTCDSSSPPPSAVLGAILVYFQVHPQWGRWWWGGCYI